MNGSAKRFFMAMCVAAIAIFIVSCKKEENKVFEEGKAPDFTLSDIHGNLVKLSALRGKVVLVEFWATWCPPCRDSVPGLNKLYAKLKGRNFELLAISVDEGKDASSNVGSFAKEQMIIYPVLLDDQKVNRRYDVSGIPVMFLIDKDGRIVNKHIGFIPGLAESLSREIEAIL